MMVMIVQCPFTQPWQDRADRTLKWANIRFLTIGTCLRAETILRELSRWVVVRLKWFTVQVCDFELYVRSLPAHLRRTQPYSPLANQKLLLNWWRTQVYICRTPTAPTEGHAC